jgi:ankyrin repeat protein
MKRVTFGLVGSLLVSALPALLAAAATDLRLVDAAKRQDRTEIRALLKARVDVNTPQPDGTTALHWAAYRDDAETIELLLRAGANANAVTDAGVTPLSLACSSDAGAPTLRLLLSANANPNLTPETGESPLMSCARTGNLEAVKLLMARGANVNAREKGRGQTALMWAAAARHPEIVKTLIEGGADVQARTEVTSELAYTGFRYITAPPANTNGIIVDAKQGGYTALLFAAQQGDVESAQLLLAAGALVNDGDAAGASTLVTAAHSGHAKVAKLLLDRGADPNAAGAGYTALHAAVLRGDGELVRALVAKGAKVDATVTAGTPVRKYGLDYALSAAWIGATPYWLAAKFAEPEIMRTLAAAHADTRVAIKDGTTPLMAALMIPQGTADRRERYQTEAQIAANTAAADDKSTYDLVALALKLGVDVNATSATGDTALHMAAGRGLTDIVKLLAENGANLDVKNKRGLTPLGIATSLRKADFDADNAATAALLGRATRTIELLRSLGATQ